jgi:membrane-associated phospholipid phosphatase
METKTDRLAAVSLYGFPAVALLIVASIRFLDEPIALSVNRLLRSNPILGEYTREIPDLLLPAVLILSAGMWIAYFLRSRKGILDDRTGFYRLAGTALPVAYLAKAAFKTLFGRIETRAWLKDAASHRLLWFQADNDHAGFPSGHMTVFAALAAACWIYFPRRRALAFSIILPSGLAMIATNYHFLSDVIAGGYLGLAVTSATRIFLERPSA